MKVDGMRVPAADDTDEFVVAPELAEVAEQLGAPLRTGDRIRCEVIEGGGASDDAPAVERRSASLACRDVLGADDHGGRLRLASCWCATTT